MKISALAFTALLFAGACDKKDAPAATAPAAAAPAPAAAAPAPAAAATAPAAQPGAPGAATPTAAAVPPPIAPGTKLKCPVSGESFTVGEKTEQLVYNGKRYAFCCADCKPEFEKNPSKYEVH